MTLVTTEAFDAAMLFQSRIFAELAHDTFQQSNGTLLNSLGYAMDTPPLGGPIPINLGEPSGSGGGTVTVRYYPLPGAHIGDVNPYPTPGWLQHISQGWTQGGRAVAGGGTTGVNYANDCDCFCCLGATDLGASLTFQWAAADGVNSQGLANLNFLAGPRINMRTAPGTPPSWDAEVLWCNVDGVNYYVLAQNLALSLQVLATGPLALTDGTVHTMQLEAEGANVTFTFDGAILAQATLNSTGSTQAGSNQMPLPHFIYGGFELYRPGPPPNYDVGPLALTQVLEYRAWTYPINSQIVNGIVNWVGDFVVDAAGNYLCWS